MLQHAVGRFVGAVGGVRGYLRFASCLGVLRTLGFYILKSATKPFNLLLACTRPLVTEFALSLL